MAKFESPVSDSHGRLVFDVVVGCVTEEKPALRKTLSAATRSQLFQVFDLIKRAFTEVSLGAGDQGRPQFRCVFKESAVSS